MEDRPRDLVAEVYRAHADRIYRYCLFRTNSHQDAEDITAEVFVKYLVNRDKVRQDLVLPWLFTVAGNLYKDQRRKRSKLQPLGDELADIEDRSSSPSDDDDVRSALGRLSRKQQQVVYLRVIEDLSFKEVAEFLHKKEVTVKALFYRGIKALQNILKEGDFNVQTLSEAQSRETVIPSRTR